MVELDRLLPAERAVTYDGGHFHWFPTAYLSVPDADAFVPAQGFQSVGLGLGSAIGTAVAYSTPPTRPVLALIGDGGAMMSLGELDSLTAQRLPVLVAIFNDAAYGAEVHHFGPLGLPTELVEFGDRDFAAVASALGARAATVRAPEDLAAPGRRVARRARRPARARLQGQPGGARGAPRRGVQGRCVMYRAETVGSMLRPDWLKQAREERAAGTLGPVEFKRMEDRAVDDALAVQEGSGLEVVTDGEMRRGHFTGALSEAITGLGDAPAEKLDWHGATAEDELEFRHVKAVTDKLGRARSLAQEEYVYLRATGDQAGEDHALEPADDADVLVQHPLARRLRRPVRDVRRRRRDPARGGRATSSRSAATTSRSTRPRSR